MKLFILCLLVTLLVVSSDAFVKWRPSKACFDCYGRRVKPGMMYYDGCNWCRCRKFGGASCTLMWCKFNRCFKKRG